MILELESFKITNFIVLGISFKLISYCTNAELGLALLISLSHVLHAVLTFFFYCQNYNVVHQSTSEKKKSHRDNNKNFDYG